MQLTKDFFLKNRYVVMSMARDLLVKELDERIQTVEYYVDYFKISRGTVQKAMQFLIENDCVATHFRGQLGSFLVSKDNLKLWEYSGFGTLSGAMALPLDSLVAGLATGICDCMKAETISFNCVFVQGSRTRINGLTQGKYDFVVASKLTQELLSKEDDTIITAIELPGCAYSGRYQLMLADRNKTELEDGMTIAVDPSVIDQMHLTTLLCKSKKNIKLNKMSFLTAHDSVMKGESDAIVTRGDTISAIEKHENAKYNIRELPLSDYYSRKKIDDFSTAVVLASVNNYGLPALLQKLLRSNVISYAQKQVMADMRVPEYY